MNGLIRRTFTQKEYALLEDNAPYKSQYVAGEIFSMDGMQPWENHIAGNLTGMLYNRFRGGPCHTYSPNMRIRVKAADLWTYASLSIVGGEPQFDRSAKIYSLLNPQVIFEVLSPATASFDRGEKFERYKRIESLTDSVLVASETLRVKQYVRQDSGGWLYHEYHEGADLLKLASVEVVMPLDKIYERVTFPEVGEGV